MATRKKKFYFQAAEAGSDARFREFEDGYPVRAIFSTNPKQVATVDTEQHRIIANPGCESHLFSNFGRPGAARLFDLG